MKMNEDLDPTQGEAESVLSVAQSSGRASSPSSPCCSGTSKKRKQDNLAPLAPGLSNGRWTESEHKAFLEGMQIHGRDWNRIANEFLNTRTSSQVRSHAQKYLAKVAKEQSAKEHGNHPPDDATYFFPGGLSSDSTAMIQRIVHSPETVEQEVEDVLQKLHERYRLLQQQLNEKRKKGHVIFDYPRSTVKFPDDSQMKIIPEDSEFVEYNDNVHVFTDTKLNVGSNWNELQEEYVDSNSCNKHSNLEEGKDELIAVQILRNGLFLQQEVREPERVVEKSVHGDYEYYYYPNEQEERMELEQWMNKNLITNNRSEEDYEHCTIAFEAKSNPSSLNGIGKVSSIISLDINQEAFTNTL